MSGLSVPRSQHTQHEVNSLLCSACAQVLTLTLSVWHACVLTEGQKAEPWAHRPIFSYLINYLKDHLGETSCSCSFLEFLWIGFWVTAAFQLVF